MLSVHSVELLTLERTMKEVRVALAKLKNNKVSEIYVVPKSTCTLNEIIGEY